MTSMPPSLTDQELRRGWWRRLEEDRVQIQDSHIICPSIPFNSVNLMTLIPPHAHQWVHLKIRNMPPVTTMKGVMEGVGRVRYRIVTLSVYLSLSTLSTLALLSRLHVCIVCITGMHRYVTDNLSWSFSLAMMENKQILTKGRGLLVQKYKISNKKKRGNQIFRCVAGKHWCQVFI